jgi:NAD(P)-dependent dehydrogenase (short-subunit alcohol dehydrogenase family)
MKLAGRVAVITGAASGIGAGLAQRFAAEGARAVVLGDVQDGPLQALADALNAQFGGDGKSFVALAQRCDVTREADIRALAQAAESRFGRIDLFCSNAGLVRDGDENTPDEIWQLNWNIHVMAHVWAARAVVPGMKARGEGYLMATASAAGLLSSLPSATYAVTKNATIAFAEKMAILHGDEGIRVSVLCPQAVATPLLRGREGKGAGVDGVMSVDTLVDAVIAGLDAERFLILPHPQVLEYFRRKATDYDRWLAGMRRMQTKIADALGRR